MVAWSLIGLACGDSGTAGTDTATIASASDPSSSTGEASSTTSGPGSTSSTTVGPTTSSSTTTTSTTTDGTDTEPDEPLPGGLVVDADWLLEHLDDPRVQPVDARVGVGDGHIPGAIALTAIPLSGTIDGVNAQVLPAADAEPVLQAAGLRNDSTAVVYGWAPEYDPARVVWALRHYQHGDVRYLDGGWDAWVAAGGESAPGLAAGEPSDYVVGAPDDSVRVTGEWVLEQLGDEPYDNVAIQLVDARSPTEWDMGRIPSALHVEWTLLLDGDGLLRPDDELLALYDGLDPSVTTVAYCLVGWRASVAWVSLRALGFDDVRVYDGSWQEWGGDPVFPVETD